MLAELTGGSTGQLRRGDPRDADAGLPLTQSETRLPASSPSGCTSSSAAATPSTRRSSPRPTATSRRRSSSSSPATATRSLLPLAFCRECGQEYYTVRTAPDRGGHGRSSPAALSDTTGDDEDATRASSTSSDGQAVAGRRRGECSSRVPDDWLEPHGDGERVKSDYRKYLPTPARVRRERSASPTTALAATGCRRRSASACAAASSHGGRQPRDFGKLTTLGAGGRSSATTILGLAAIRSLRADESLDPRRPQAARASPTTARTPRSRRPLQRLRRGRPPPLGAVPGRGGGRARRARRTTSWRCKVFDALALPLELVRGRPGGPRSARARSRPGASRRARLPALPRPRARLADHRAEPRAVRAARDPLRVARRALRGRGRLGERAPGARDGATRSSATGSRTSCSTTCAASSRSASTTSTPTGRRRCKQRSSQFLVDPWAIDEDEELDPRARSSTRSRGVVPPASTAATSTSRRAAASASTSGAPTRSGHSERLTLDDTERDHPRPPRGAASARGSSSSCRPTRARRRARLPARRRR